MSFAKIIWYSKFVEIWIHCFPKHVLRNTIKYQKIRGMFGLKWHRKKFRSQNSEKIHRALLMPLLLRAAAVHHHLNQNPNRYIQYGNTSCRVFKRGVQIWKYFLQKNQHTQRKWLNFEHCCNGEVSKFGHHFTKQSELKIDGIKKCQ